MKKCKKIIGISLLSLFCTVCLTSCITATAVALYAVLHEDTEHQLKKIAKISEIEEYILHDCYGGSADWLEDETYYSHYEFFLKNGGFIQVNHLTFAFFDREDVKVRYTAFGDYEFPDGLTYDDLSALTGEKIDYLNMVVFYYDLIIAKIQELDNLKLLDKSTLPLRKNEILEDLQKMPHVKNVRSAKFKNYYYPENYYFYLSMDDGHEILMSISDVNRKEGTINSRFNIIKFDDKYVEYSNVTVIDKPPRDYFYTMSGYYCLGKYNSYRDFFENYEKMPDTISKFMSDTEFLKQKRYEENPNRKEKHHEYIELK